MPRSASSTPRRRDPDRRLRGLCLGLVLASTAGACAGAERPMQTIRIATYNVWELGAEKVDRVDAAGHGTDPQLRAAAEVVQRLRPDLLLLNEIDVLEERNLAQDFVERFLRVAQAPGLEPIDYPFVLAPPVNTGHPSGLDFDRNGRLGDPEDAWGFGRYPGQYGMALLSRLPIDGDALRSFRLLRWQTMPGHLMPDGIDGRPAWYDAAMAAALRLSSKTHVDVPVRLPDGRQLHVLASHPTPPVFDGDEDRNGRRNHDELRLWADYLRGGEAAAWIVDDQGRRGGLDADASFVLLGDLNADPYADSPYGGPAIRQLLEHPRVADPAPRGDGEPAGERAYAGPPRSRTNEHGRLDYALPSRDLVVVASGLFAPAPGDPLRRLVAGEGRASDHLLVWVDLRLPTRP